MPADIDFLKAHMDLLGSPYSVRAILLKKPNSKYEDFVHLVHEMIDSSLYDMQNNRMHYQDLHEEGLTSVLTTFFRSNGIQASEKLNNGHCDIVIELMDKQWQWMGEAKIHRDYAYLHKGMNQLFGRYTSGDEGQDHGGMIIYIKNINATKVIDDWEKYLHDELSCCKKLTRDNNRSDLSFKSEHAHNSGRSFHVKHVGIMLHYKPDDDKNIKPKADRKKAKVADLSQKNKHT